MSPLEHRLSSLVSRASHDFRLIEPNDRIMVCVSGGKDSLGMLHLLQQIQKRAPFPFELIAVNLDQGQPGHPKEILPKYFAGLGCEYRIIEEDTYSIVKQKIPEGDTYCSLCSRLRRGVLYNVAEQLGATKMALGHHRDDAIHTLLLNLFFSGQLKSMPPWLRSDDGRNTVIRPLIYCQEADLEAFAKEKDFPIVPCNLCGSQEHLQRKRVRRLVEELTRENPHVPGNLFSALTNVRPTHLFDKELWAKLGLWAAEGPEVQEEGVQHLVQLGLGPLPDSNAGV